jgi:hypothetical protein
VAIVPPPPAEGVDAQRFLFRILRGHTVETLQKHRSGSLRAYLWFLAGAFGSVGVGEEFVRDSLQVKRGPETPLLA